MNWLLDVPNSYVTQFMLIALNLARIELMRLEFL